MGEFHRGPHLKTQNTSVRKFALLVIFSINFPVFKDVWVRVLPVDKFFSFAVCCLAFCLPVLAVELQTFVEFISLLSCKCSVRCPNNFCSIAGTKGTTKDEP